MNKILHATCIVILLTSFSVRNNKESLPKDQLFSTENFSQPDEIGEILVIFEKMSVKDLEEISICFSSVKGLKMIGYCEKLKCFSFTYDSTIHRSPENAFEALELATKKYVPVLKSGTFIQVSQICQN